MTNSNGGKEPGSGGKSLKDQNRWQLWLIVAVNWIFLYGVVQANAIRLDGLSGAFSDIQKLIPAGLALVIATVLNGLLNADVKARLVFLRWRNVLPGHRAFSEYAIADPRIDPSALVKVIAADLPIEPLEQNRTWYRLYRTVENDPAVRQVHRDFLLLRDYTGFCVLFIVFYGAVGLYAIRSLTTALLYLALLVLQYIIVRQAASNYGIRFVTTVLALKAAKHETIPSSPRAKAPKKKQPPKDAKA
jgi:hypothetical protein